MVFKPNKEQNEEQILKEENKKIIETIEKNKEEKKSCFIVTDKDFMVKRAGRNLPWLNCMGYSRLNVHDLYYSHNLIVTEDAVVGLDKMLSDKESV